jgi:hypothetical protein
VGQTVTFGFDPRTGALCFAAGTTSNAHVFSLNAVNLSRNSARLMLDACCMAPALLWLLGLIVLPHVDLGHFVVARNGSLRGVYEPSLAQFADLCRRAAVLAHLRAHGVMSIVATAITLLLAFPHRLDNCQNCPGPRQVDDVCDVSDSVLGKRDGAHPGLDDFAA